MDEGSGGKSEDDCEPSRSLAGSEGRQRDESEKGQGGASSPNRKLAHARLEFVKKSPHPSAYARLVAAGDEAASSPCTYGSKRACSLEENKVAKIGRGLMHDEAYSEQLRTSRALPRRSTESSKSGDEARLERSRAHAQVPRSVEPRSPARTAFLPERNDSHNWYRFSLLHRPPAASSSLASPRLGSARLALDPPSPSKLARSCRDRLGHRADERDVLALEQ